MSTVFEKTWQFDLNRAAADNTTVGNLSRSFAWWVKEFLKGNMVDPIAGVAPAAGQWTVFGSCDSATAGLDGVDRWGTVFDKTKIVRPMVAITSASLFTTPSATGGSLAAGIYRYLVFAIDDLGRFGPQGSEVSATTTGTTGSVAITWTSYTNGSYNTGAPNFRIFRTAVNGATGTESLYQDVTVGSGGSQTFTDTGAGWLAGSTSGITQQTVASVSWIVLKSPLMTTPAGSMNFYYTIAYSGTTDQAPLTIVGSKAAPTGGSITARPTATDEWVHTANLQVNDSTNGTMRWNGWLTTDGTFVVAGAKTGSGLFSVGLAGVLLGDTASVDQYPFATFVAYSTGTRGAFTDSTFYANANWRMRTFDGSVASVACSPVAMQVQNTSVCGLSYPVGTGDFTTGSLGDMPIYFGDNTASKASIRGRIKDLLYMIGGAASGTVEPIVGTIQSAVLGHLWIPANSGFIL